MFQIAIQEVIYFNHPATPIEIHTVIYCYPSITDEKEGQIFLSSSLVATQLESSKSGIHFWELQNLIPKFSATIFMHSPCLQRFINHFGHCYWPIEDLQTH